MSGRNITIIDTSSLSPLAKRINDAAAAAEQHARSAVDHALTVGGLLIEAKSQVPHGHWDEWLTSNCTVAPRTARAYMKLAKDVPLLPESKRQRVADLPVREAVRAIATSPDAPPRSVCTGIRVAGASDRQRVGSAFRKAATDLRTAGKWIETTAELKPAQVEKLRNKLMAAIEQLDKLAGGAAA